MNLIKIIKIGGDFIDRIILVIILGLKHKSLQ